MAKRLAVSVYGPPVGIRRGMVSGLPVFERRLAALLEEQGVELVPVRLTNRGPSNRAQGVLANAAERRFYMSEEARHFGLPWDARTNQFQQEILRYLDQVKADALYIVEWSSVGMALWEAALESGRKVAFIPTEHLAACAFGFMLSPSGKPCEGPEDGRKCSSCTLSLELPSPESLGPPWFSERHRLFHLAAQTLPAPMRRTALRLMAGHLQRKGAAISETEGKARVISARRFLTSGTLVAYQSPHQHRLFERALGCRLDAALPPLLPVPALGAFEGKDVDARTRPVTFLFAARPDFDRGLWQLLDAWAAWNPASGQARLLVHTHSIPRSLRGRLQSLKARGDIEVHIGRLDERALRAVHRQCHYVVNPAAWEEPGSATVYEGLFHGTPSLVPSLTGSADFIADRINGIVYPFRSIDGLVAALRAASDEMERWPSMHVEALRSAESYLENSNLHVKTLTTMLLGDAP
jgi:glycosyltransferase involved in cell wall biosynthesis